MQQKRPVNKPPRNEQGGDQALSAIIDWLKRDKSGEKPAPTQKPKK